MRVARLDFSDGVSEGGKLETHCYQRRDGKLLWKQKVTPEKLEDFYATEGSPASSITCKPLDAVKVVERAKLMG